jgi:hypothetical protein
MAIIVRNTDLEERLARIAVSQPIPSTKTELLEQVGILAVAAVDATGDPQAWRGIWMAPPLSEKLPMLTPKDVLAPGPD